MPPPLQSTTYTFDDVLEVNEYYQEQGWTDGLSIVPPTAAQVTACLFRHTRLLRHEWATVGKRAIVDRGGGPQQEFRALREPADLLVVAAGGPAGGFGAIIPPWLGSRFQAVTHVIDEW